MSEGRIFNPSITPRQALDLFGVDAQSLNVNKILLDTAESEREKNFGASTALWVQDATSLTAQTTIKFNRQAGTGLKLKKGLFIRGLRFSRVYFTHAAQANESLTIVTFNETDLGFAIENPSADASLADITKASVIDTIADVSVTAASTVQILASNTDRRVAHISNLSGSVTLRIGDANAGAARGRVLLPGDTCEIRGTEAIFAFNPDAAAVLVGLTWEAD